MQHTPLAQRVAVVTGASSGLGYAVCEHLSKENVTVYALARTIESTQFSSPLVHKIPCNIRDPKSIDTAFHTIHTHTKTIDFLVNCAGRRLVKDLEETSREEIMDVFGINLKGNIYIVQEVYTQMIAQHHGHIINVISTSGKKGHGDEPIYCASKWGLWGFTESLRLAAIPHHIRVTAVFPGGMKTNFWQHEDKRNPSSFMDPAIVAAEIVHILETPSSIAPSEYIIERGVATPQS